MALNSYAHRYMYLCKNICSLLPRALIDFAATDVKCRVLALKSLPFCHYGAAVFSISFGTFRLILAV